MLATPAPAPAAGGLAALLAGEAPAPRSPPPAEDAGGAAEGGGSVILAAEEVPAPRSPPPAAPGGGGAAPAAGVSQNQARVKMEKCRKHKHTDSSFSAGFLLCTDHNTFAATFVMRLHFKLGLPPVSTAVDCSSVQIVRSICSFNLLCFPLCLRR